jgi:hypothetical protein
MFLWIFLGLAVMGKLAVEARFRLPTRLTAGSSYT